MKIRIRLAGQAHSIVFETGLGTTIALEPSEDREIIVQRGLEDKNFVYIVEREKE